MKNLGPKRIRSLQTFIGIVLVGLVVAVNAHGAGHADGVDMMLDNGPGQDDVTLNWTGGQPAFEVFQSSYPDDVGEPTNKLGETSTRTWIDTTSGDIFFYFVNSPCIVDPPEVCDGVDNDCNGEIDEDYIPTPTSCGEGECAGNTGQIECQGGVEVDTCNPFEGATPDICDNLDNDCDPSTPDGSDDPLQGLPCDGPDGDLCEEGYYFCAGGVMDCSDYTSTTFEQCNGIDDDCDGDIDEGFPRDDNPPCTPEAYYIGQVFGDSGSDIINYSDWSEEWSRFMVIEDSPVITYLSATIQLWSPPGTDYDLFVYCDSCYGNFAGSSYNSGMSGHYDTVEVRANDEFAFYDDFHVFIEVRHYNSVNCNLWMLKVTGNTTVSEMTCD